MAKSAPRFSTIHNSGQFLLRRNPKRTLGENPCGTGGTNTDGGRAKRKSQLRNYRLAKCKNCLVRRRTGNRRKEKTKGRKRHIVVDTMGNLLTVVVHAANIHDTKSGILAARDAFVKYPSNGSVLMQDTAKPLRRMFLANWASVLIFQYALSLSGRSCPRDGLLSVPWLGSTIPADFPKITRYLFVLLRLFVLLLLFVPC